MTMLRDYECTVPAWGMSQVIAAKTAGAARFRWLRNFWDAGYKVTFGDIRVRSLGPAVVRRPPGEADAEAWNARYPIGTPVRFWTGLREGEGRLSKTRTTAQVMSGHASVWMEGLVGSVSLSHVEAVEPGGEA